METSLPSAPSRRRIKTEQITLVPPKNGCMLSLQSTNLSSDLTCPVQVKQEADLPQSEYLPWLQFKEIKKEFQEMNGLIKNEQSDDLSSEASPYPSDDDDDDDDDDDGLPHGLIPPVEMEDGESDVECPENLNACQNKISNKKRTASKVKNHALNMDRKHTQKRRKAQENNKYDRVEVCDGRTLLKACTNDDGEGAFLCETCGKQFKRFDLLRDHRRGHGRKRPYACDQCDMMFAKPSYLKIHLRRHAGERTFPCDKCDKRFFDKYDLGVHQRVHTGERPYECPECGKTFKRVNTLNKHKKTHSSEKPFKCNVCGKAYKYGYSYRLHMKNHSS